MKSDSTEAKKLAALLKRLKSKYQPEPYPPREPVLQMIVGFLQWQATRELAEQTLGEVLSQVVDINELRVSLESEIAGTIGDDYPQVHERVARLRESLNDIYNREHAVEMLSIVGRGKKEQRAYLDSLPGIPPYVAALVMLSAFGGHAMPVDDKLAALLAEEGVIEAGTTTDQAEAALLRMVKAEEAAEVHLLLQAWSDDSEMPELEEVEAAEAADDSSAGKTTKKTTKRTTARRSKKK